MELCSTHYTINGGTIKQDLCHSNMRVLKVTAFFYPCLHFQRFSSRPFLMWGPASLSLPRFHVVQAVFGFFVPDFVEWAMRCSGLLTRSPFQHACSCCQHADEVLVGAVLVSILRNGLETATFPLRPLKDSLLMMALLLIGVLHCIFIKFCICDEVAFLSLSELSLMRWFSFFF